MSGSNEVRRTALLNIEQEMKSRLEALRIPVPRHFWTVSSDGSYSEAELTCVRSNGTEITIGFSCDELDCFDHSSRFGTFAKLAALASALMEDSRGEHG